MTALREKSLTPKSRVMVLLVDDHKDMRTELRKILDVTSDIQVVGEAADGKQAVEMAKKHRPSVVVMDIAMPKLNGLEATRLIRQGLPDTKVLICSAHSDEGYVERAMAVGAAGYINKLTVAEVLVTATREVQKGNTFLSPAIAKRFKKRKAHL